MKLSREMLEAVGVSYLLAEMSPLTPYGAALVRNPPAYGPGEAEALARQWRNVGAAQRALTEGQDALRRMEHVMMQVREIRGVLARMDEAPLTEVELFEVKRFALQMEALTDLYTAMDMPLEGIVFDSMAEALCVLDPKGLRASGFSLVDVGGRGYRELLAEKRRLEHGPEGEMEARRALVAEEARLAHIIRRDATRALMPAKAALLHNAEMTGRLDYTLLRAKLAAKRNMVMPAYAEGSLCFAGMTNPRAADALPTRGTAFTPVSIEMPMGVTVVTGANMGGKSLALKTLLLNVCLCQMGFFACAKSARLPLFDEIYYLHADAESEETGLSSFAGEIVSIQAALDRVASGRRCLVVMDEPARGTNPAEGAALVRALAQWLAARPVLALIATHYDGVSGVAQAHYRAARLRALPEDGTGGVNAIAQRMEYGLMRVDKAARAPREALAIARYLGLTPSVLDAMARTLDEV